MCARVWPENVRVVLTPTRLGASTVRSTRCRPSGTEKKKYTLYIYISEEKRVCLFGLFSGPQVGGVWLRATDLMQFTAPARSDRGDAGGGGDAGRGEGGGLVSPDSTSVLPSGHAQVNEHTHGHGTRAVCACGG